MAAQLGKGADAVMGAYNPKDDSHDPKKPDTWKINDWKQIHVSFVDGNGKRLPAFPMPGKFYPWQAYIRIMMILQM